jgi:hypothetical protein
MDILTIMYVKRGLKILFVDFLREKNIASNIYSPIKFSKLA